MLTVSISGPPMSGKTRLLRVIAAALENEGHSLCTFDGSEHPIHPRPLCPTRPDYKPFPVVVLTVETPEPENPPQC